MFSFQLDEYNQVLIDNRKKKFEGEKPCLLNKNNKNIEGEYYCFFDEEGFLTVKDKNNPSIELYPNYDPTLESSLIKLSEWIYNPILSTHFEWNPKRRKMD